MVFADLSFQLEPGDALVLRGPNGSGKSTLLRLLAGFLRPSAGALAWAGSTVAAADAEQRGRLHFVGHADPLKPLLTVAENLAFAAGLAGGQSGLAGGPGRVRSRAPGETPVRFLSAGQKRRANLARLLAVPRPLWLLDEPGVGLDAASRARLEQAVGAQRAAAACASSRPTATSRCATPTSSSFAG